MSSNAMMRDYMERLVPLQEIAEENKNHLNEIKREARSDGLNLDALNALLPVIGKYPHDKGARVLSEVIRYAEAFGTEELVARGDGEAHASSGGQARADLPQVPQAATSPRAEAKPRGLGFGALRLPAQVAASLCVTFGLIWLLN